MANEEDTREELGEVPESRTNPDVNEYEDYTEDDLRHVFEQGDFNSWDEVIAWIRDFGDHDNYLEPGRDKMIKDDLEMLRDNGVLFTKDSGIVYRTALENR